MYPIKPYHFQQAKKLGVTIQPSKKKNYKLDVFKDGDYVTSIGHKKYKDYAIYLEEKGQDYANERRRLYNLRHKNDNGIRSIFSTILW